MNRLLRTVPLALAVVLVMRASAAAQAVELPRGDAGGFIGWQLANVGSVGDFGRDDWESSLFGGGGLGIYWTQHLKTDVDFGSSTTARARDLSWVTVGGVQTHRSSDVRFSRRTLGISQQYQFLENAWFHPYVAAGVHVAWERQTVELSPVYAYDPTLARTLLVEPGRTDGPTTESSARPFVGTGFKSYLTPQWFFRMDSRLALRRGLDEVHVRAGFGRDW